MFSLLFSISILFSSPLQVGDQAPDFSIPNSKGKMISLSDFKGKIVLLDFWASWCAPCRKENPNILEAYEKYRKVNFQNGAQFEIISISLDQDKSKWLQAIKADGLKWKTHLSELKGWNSSAGKAYGVSAIPMSFLIDEMGKIVAKGSDLKGIDLHIQIDKLLE